MQMRCKWGNDGAFIQRLVSKQRAHLVMQVRRGVEHLACQYVSSSRRVLSWGFPCGDACFHAEFFKNVFDMLGGGARLHAANAKC